MGTAMAAGLEHHNLLRTKGAPSMVSPYVAASVVWEELVLQFLDAGGVVTDETYETRVPPLMQRALEHYAANDIISTRWQIHAVERVFEAGGRARPDLIVVDEDGLAPVDYKMKEKLYVKEGETRDAARSRTLMEFADDWQLKHYVWCIRRFLGQPCDHYYIVLGELSPKPHFTIQRFEVTNESMQQWSDSAYQWWAEMYDTESDIVNLPRMAPTHETKYGPCEYQYACLEAGLEKEKYRHKYVQIERRGA